MSQVHEGPLLQTLSRNSVYPDPHKLCAFRHATPNNKNWSMGSVLTWPNTTTVVNVVF